MPVSICVDLDTTGSVNPQFSTTTVEHSAPPITETCAGEMTQNTVQNHAVEKHLIVQEVSEVAARIQDQIAETIKVTPQERHVHDCELGFRRTEANGGPRGTCTDEIDDHGQCSSGYEQVAQWLVNAQPFKASRQDDLISWRSPVGGCRTPEARKKASDFKMQSSRRQKPGTSHQWGRQGAKLQLRSVTRNHEANDASRTAPPTCGSLRTSSSTTTRATTNLPSSRRGEGSRESLEVHSTHS